MGGHYTQLICKAGFICLPLFRSTKSQVAEFEGEEPCIGTDPHTLSLPTEKALGFDFLNNWANSRMGMIYRYAKSGKPLSPGATIVLYGKETTDP